MRDEDYLEIISKINGKLEVINELITKLQADKVKLAKQYAEAKAKHDA